MSAPEEQTQQQPETDDLDSETLQDLDPQEDESDQVRGGPIRCQARGTT